MEKFTKRNAITATVLNLIINILAPFIIFHQYEAINLKGTNPTVVDLLIPTVMISVFATTMATFVTMTKQRMARKLEPSLNATTNWFLTALFTALALGFAFAGLAYLFIKVIQLSQPNFKLTKPVALVLSGLVGSLVALGTSFIAVNRARLIL
ncbi:hypothetical protein [Spirosoma pollinicola]|uniref:Uncharacterized protein n=1 Tax=Spirosoma pollinicola TaxID=2057025 RepID=A0A2K8Z220_9BACT|nr:hypothetical protein [Spirosoma pollinicola]AUD03879.1 hypothetical protein CWM47_19855 [Spirosoma pollinicola]